MEGRPIRILLAIWGNYKNWRTATYKYRGEEFTSSTTLPLLFKAIEPDYTYVIVADTLMDEYMDEVNSNYQQGIEKVREKTKIYIEEKMGEYTNDLEEKNLDILVLPGVGTFSKLKFIGDPNNFYALVYYKLGKSILKIMNDHKLIFGNSKEENKPCIEFYLDITHGLNYMTMMTYRAVKDILQIVAYFCKVQLVVLNSDPYPLLKSGGEGFLLNINEIERINVIPVFNFYRYHHLKLLKPSEFFDNEERENIGRTINQKKTMEKVRKD
ncbi:MAG: CRISPR-associated CARF protein Csx1, partial [Aquificaceae bacterium]